VAVICKEITLFASGAIYTRDKLIAEFLRQIKLTIQIVVDPAA